MGSRPNCAGGDNSVTRDFPQPSSQRQALLRLVITRTSQPCNAGSVMLADAALPTSGAAFASRGTAWSFAAHEPSFTSVRSSKKSAGQRATYNYMGDEEPIF